MAHTTILSTGAVAFRTKLMDLGQGARFASCLRANARFCDVEKVHSDRAKGDKAYYVTFRPSSDSRATDIWMGQWDKRQAKANAEGGDYLFVQDGWKWWVYNPISEETYEVDSTGCSCPDHVYRCAKSGLRCKHWLALKDRQSEAIAA